MFIVLEIVQKTKQDIRLSKMGLKQFPKLWLELLDSIKCSEYQVPKPIIKIESKHKS